MTKSVEKKTSRKITTTQFKFLMLVLDGVKPSQAYQEIYKCSKRVASASASRLINRNDIKEILNREREKILKFKREQAMLLIVNEFEKLGFSGISNFLEYDRNGERFFDSNC